MEVHSWMVRCLRFRRCLMQAPSSKAAIMDQQWRTGSHLCLVQTTEVTSCLKNLQHFVDLGPLDQLGLCVGLYESIIWPPRS